MVFSIRRTPWFLCHDLVFGDDVGRVCFAIKVLLLEFSVMNAVIEDGIVG